MTSTKQMIVQAFSKAFNKYFYNELVVGKLAHSELKQSINKGDEVDITMPGVVRLFDYDGGDLPTAEAATLSTCKVKIDRGKAFHFELSEMEEKMIEANKETPDNIILTSLPKCSMVKLIHSKQSLCSLIPKDVT